MSGAGVDASGPVDSSEVTGQTVVATAVVIVMILSDVAGQSRTSDEHA